MPHFRLDTPFSITQARNEIPFLDRPQPKMQLCPYKADGRKPQMISSGRLGRFISAACEGVCGICLLLIAIFTLYEITSRYVFDSPTLWAQDVSVYLMIWCAFLGLLPTDRAGQHIRIDVWYKHLPARSRLTLERVTYILIAAFAAIATWKGAEIAGQSLRLGRRSLSLFSVPMWIPQAALVVGMGLFAIECLWRALKPGRVAEGSAS
jgi:TRAP-type C4-dicarboxylate transport system permease small subunit